MSLFAMTALLIVGTLMVGWPFSSVYGLLRCLEGFFGYNSQGYLLDRRRIAFVVLVAYTFD